MTNIDTTYRHDLDAATTPGDLRYLDDLEGWEVADGEADPRGRDLVGSDGEKIGVVEDLIASPTTQRAHFAVVDTGGYFANRQSLVPMRYLRIGKDDVFGPFTKAMFEHAPEWPGNDRDYARHSAYWSDALGAWSDAETQAPGDAAAGSGATTEEYRVPFTHEDVVVNKRLREAGHLLLRKRVETETRHVSEPVRKTHVTVEVHEAGAPATPGESVTELRPGETLRIPILEEDVDIDTVQRNDGEVVIRATAETENVERDVELHREIVDVDEDGDLDVERTPHEAGRTSA